MARSSVKVITFINIHHSFDRPNARKINLQIGYHWVSNMWEWLLLAGVMLMGAMIPGANMALVLRNTLNGNTKDGIATALGMSCALTLHVLLSILGLAAIIHETPIAYDSIRWLGSAYLVYMGVTFMLTKPCTPDGQTSRRSNSHPFISGMMVSLFNPKILLMFIALFSQIMQAQQEWTTKLLYGATPVVIEFSWLMFVIWLLSRPTVQQKLLSTQKMVERWIGGALLILGVKIGLG